MSDLFTELQTLTGNPQRLNLEGTFSLTEPKQELVIQAVRELVQDDLFKAEIPLDEDGTTPSLRKMRTSHHRIAQLLSSGMKESDISLQTGYAVSTISILKNDPAFKELLQHYCEEQRASHSDMVERLATLATDAIDVMQERLVEQPDLFTNGQLLEVIKAGADRSHAAPISKSYNVQETRTLDLTIVQQMKEQIKEVGNVKFIERSTTVVEQATDTSGRERAAISDNGAGDAEIISIEEETERLTSQGNTIRE